jgi:homoserine kinase type II
MSVFTPLPQEQLAPWLENYAIGRLLALEGIATGVQNSNFFVTTTLGRYVLTLFEDIPRAELPYYLHLMAHLARHGLPVPAPIANRDGEYLGTLAGKPAVLVSRLHGTIETNPASEHCARIGAMLAGIHLAGGVYGRNQPNPRGAAWRNATAARVRPFLPAAEFALLDDELDYQRGLDLGKLPQGAIHADLFRDNVLWTNAHDIHTDSPFIGGVIDFYFSGIDTLLFDVAVTVNDWCATPDGSLDPGRTRSLLAAYHETRPFTATEGEIWPTMLRAAALRFWLSRAADLHLPRDGELVLVKNPDEFRDILIQRRAHCPPLLPMPTL